MPLTNDATRHIVRFYQPVLGSDPELFVATKGQVIGAEKVIPKEGLKTTKSSIVLDGVQLELHPTPNNCRALIANDFKAIFIKLKAQLDAKGATASFDPLIKMDKQELAKLSEQARILGCAPSKNVANPTATIKVPKNFRTRSAGGHIHVQLMSGQNYNYHPYNTPIQPANIEVLIKLFDCLVGLPSVLIDRDPHNAERRKLYGRASEYRDYTQGAAGGLGVEYRVLSNYWLRSYQLMSFVHGMIRQATNIYFAQWPHYNAHYWNAPQELFSRVDIEKVWEAINKNNYHLALKQWEGVESFIDEFCADTQSGLWSGASLPSFRFFAKQVKEKGLSYWFPEEPMAHWCNIPEGHQFNDDGFAGWESFIMNLVTNVKSDVEVDDVITRLKGAA